MTTLQRWPRPICRPFEAPFDVNAHCDPRYFRVDSYWRKRRSAKRTEPKSDDAHQWARELIRLRRTNAIVTPVFLEFIAGAHSREELGLFKAFLEAFDVVDDRRLTPEGWDRAAQYAERVPKDGKPRQLGD